MDGWEKKNRFECARNCLLLFAAIIASVGSLLGELLGKSAVWQGLGGLRGFFVLGVPAYYPAHIYISRGSELDPLIIAGLIVLVPFMGVVGVLIDRRFLRKKGGAG